jgi:hypothetical protein
VVLDGAKVFRMIPSLSTRSFSHGKESSQKGKEEGREEG